MIQIRGLFQLTVRTLWANYITAGLFIVSTLAWLFILFALNLDIVEGTLTGLRLFGQDLNLSSSVRDPDSGEWVRRPFLLDDVVMETQAFIASASYLLGTFLGLFATATLLSDLLAKGHIDLLLSKPMSRLKLLMGHLLGVWATAFILGTYLIGSVWLVMALKSGIWNFLFLLAIPVTTVMFGVMFSVILLVGIRAQNTALPLIAAYGLIFISIFLSAQDRLAPLINEPWRTVYMSFYHVLPNFIEVTQIVSQLSTNDPVTSWYPFVSSVVFGVVVYAVAAFWFSRRDF